MSHTPLGGRAATLLPAIPALAFVLALTGCGASYEASYASAPAPVVVDNGDYLYYPGDEVYYDSVANVYVYRDHDHWVRHREPPPHFVRNSASVHMNFHDSPEHHHAEVSKSYPRTWKRPPEGHHDHDRDHDKDHDHDNH